MDISHLLLGRPWEFDRKIIHDGALNTYSFYWETHKIFLLPSRDDALPAPPSPPQQSHLPMERNPTLLCFYSAFMTEFQQEGIVYALFPDSSHRLLTSSSCATLAPVLAEFVDVFYFRHTYLLACRLCVIFSITSTWFRALPFQTVHTIE